MDKISSLHGIALSAWAIAGLTGNQIADLIVAQTGDMQNILIFTVALYAVALLVDIFFVKGKSKTQKIEPIEE